LLGQRLFGPRGDRRLNYAEFCAALKQLPSHQRHQQLADLLPRLMQDLELLSAAFSEAQFGSGKNSCHASTCPVFFTKTRGF
jgi:hypothetical protein